MDNYCYYHLVIWFFVIKGIWQKNWRQVIGRGFVLVLAVMFTFLPVFYSIRWLPTIMDYRVWYEGEYDINKVHSFDPADSEKYIELDEFLDAFLGRIMTMLRNADAKNPFVLQAYAAEIERERVELVETEWISDPALKIRATIYKAYLEDLTWYGNPPGTGFYLIGDSDYQSWHAQNLWIQIAYSFGIPSGILLVVLTVMLLISHFKVLQKSRENVYAIIPFFMCVLVFAFGLMEIVWNPGQLAMLLFFFVQHPQIKNCESCVSKESVIE